MKLTKTEMLLICQTADDATVIEVERKSDREFNISFKGFVKEGYAFSSWLPLAWIHKFVLWTHPDIAKMTDYPEMARDGDWSAVRDSSEDKIWSIFNYYHRFPK